MFVLEKNQVRRHEVSIEPILWIYTLNKQGFHPVKLRVTFQRRRRYYPVQYKSRNLFLSKADWNAVSAKPKGELARVKAGVQEVVFKANSAVSKLSSGNRPFTFAGFEENFFVKEASVDFLRQFEVYLERLLMEERHGSYSSYQCAYRALVAFVEPEMSLSPYDVTVDFLRRFEKFLRDKRKAGGTTVGIYMRELRAIYNVCALEDVRLKDVYPFGTERKGKYPIKASNKSSKKFGALTGEQVKRLMSYKCDRYSRVYEAKQYWLFSFFCQGMNFRDIAHLKYRNIVNGVIRYTRQKTKRTEEHEVLEIPVTDAVRAIIEALGNQKRELNDYVFPVLLGASDSLSVEKIIRQKIKTVNGWLKRLCKEIGLPLITTYWSRHTYASLLKYSGVSVEMIRELLGHSDIKTTEHYLRRFDNAARAKVNADLIEAIATAS